MIQWWRGSLLTLALITTAVPTMAAPPTALQISLQTSWPDMAEPAVLAGQNDQMMCTTVVWRDAWPLSTLEERPQLDCAFITSPQANDRILP